jgi:hypothetical protein
MSKGHSYLGEGQPSLSKRAGWLGRVGNLLGSGESPTYLGTGQPMLRSPGLFAGILPAYRQDAAVEPTPCTTEEAKPNGMNVACATLVCPADCDPFVSGPIALIVPRQG